MDNEPVDNGIFETVTRTSSIGYEVFERSLGLLIIFTRGYNGSRQGASLTL